MKFIKKIMFFGLLITVITTVPVFAAHSPNWYQKDGNWRIKDSNGNDIVNTTIDDDEAQGVYLIDANGNMVTGFVKIPNNTVIWLFFETTPGKDYGKKRIRSGYYNGLYLDMVAGGSGVIKNINEAIVGNFTEVTPHGVVFTYELLPPSNSNFIANSANMPPDDRNSSNIIYGIKDINKYIEQCLSEFDSSYLQYTYDGSFVTTVMDTVIQGNGLFAASFQPIHISFIDAATGEQQVLQISATPENIRWAINKLRR